MATLTWRNVEAPNFSGALEGYRTASQLLGNATRAGQDVVGQFTQANSDAADRAILQRAMGVQTSDAMRQGLADGSIVGSDGANASLETLRGVDNRVGTLLNRDVVQQSYDQTGYTNRRTRDANSRLDAAADPLADLEVAARNGDTRTVNAILQANPQMRGLLPSQFSNAVDRADTLRTGFQSRRGTDEAFGMTVRNNDRTVRYEQDADDAQRALLEVIRNSTNTGEATAEIEKRIGRMSPGAAQRLLNGARGAGYPVYAPLTSDTTLPSGSGTSSQSVGLSPTDNPQLDSFISGLAKLETAGGAKTIKGPKGEDSNNLFNIKDPTGAGYRALDKAEGSNDAYRVFSNPQESRAALMDLLGRKYPAALTAKTPEEFATALKAGGYATDPDYVKKLTAAIGTLPTEAEQASTAFTGTLVDQLVDTRASQNKAASLFEQLAASEGNSALPIDVANKLVSKDGRMPGASLDKVLGQLNSIIKNSSTSGGRTLNAAQAAEILVGNLEPEDTGFIAGVRDAYGRGFQNQAEGITILADAVGAGGIIPDSVRKFTAQVSDKIGGALQVNQRSVSETVDAYLKGNNSTQQAAQTSLKLVKEQRQKAERDYTAAQEEYKLYLAQSRARPALASRLPALEQKVIAAREALAEMNQSVPNSDTLVPRNIRNPVNTVPRGAEGSW